VADHVGDPDEYESFTRELAVQDAAAGHETHRGRRGVLTRLIPAHAGDLTEPESRTERDVVNSHNHGWDSPRRRRLTFRDESYKDISGHNSMRMSESRFV
jgi:hypothetical protein